MVDVRRFGMLNLLLLFYVIYVCIRIIFDRGALTMSWVLGFACGPLGPSASETAV